MVPLSSSRVIVQLLLSLIRVSVPVGLRFQLKDAEITEPVNIPTPNKIITINIVFFILISPFVYKFVYYYLALL